MKYFGLKIEKWDTQQTYGYHFLFWYPKSKTRLAYAGLWLPLPKFLMVKP